MWVHSEIIIVGLCAGALILPCIGLDFAGSLFEEVCKGRVLGDVRPLKEMVGRSKAHCVMQCTLGDCQIVEYDGVKCRMFQETNLTCDGSTQTASLYGKVNPCHNGGSLDKNGQCVCTPDFLGELCEEANRLVGGSDPGEGRVELVHDGQWGPICDDGWDNKDADVVCSEGRVELVHDGQWGTICDDNWDTRDADVVCRQFGYASGMAYSWAYFGAGEGQIWLDDVECTGNETAIWECEHSPWGVHDCHHIEDAGVKCSN